ncbi:MAG: hypothetical protein PWP65_1849 [Clostridia bacterium]|nr:hypothetical protein [Clostridia bacterium]
MKELVVVSGKGGTGKTSLVGAFAALCKNAVLADCDVDAADLHLILQPEIQEQHEFYGGHKAQIRPEKCNRCGKCLEVCRFEAINEFKVNSFSCEGCGVCSRACPEEAIVMAEHLSGHWFISATPYGPLVHARLGLAEDNSGKLVAQVRQMAKTVAFDQKKDLILTDGPPGIGCPVISAITGADLVLVVAEPTVAGLHDLGRVLDLTAYFRIPALVCLNKWDLAPEKSEEIETYCRERGAEVAGKIPFDVEVFKAVASGRPLVEVSQGPAAQAVQELWLKLQTRIGGD